MDLLTGLTNTYDQGGGGGAENRITPMTTMLHDDKTIDFER